MKSIGEVLTRPTAGPSNFKAAERCCIKHRATFTSFSTAPGVWSGCPTCADEHDAEEKDRAWRESREKSKAAAERRALEEWQEKMKRCGIPPRFSGKTFASFKADTSGKQTVLKFSNEYAAGFDDNPGKCAVFIGTPGTGKTHLAVAIGLDLLSRGKSVLFCTAIRAIRRIKDTWTKGATETESEAVSSLVWPDLLILDEVGVQFGSDTEKVLMFDVLNERYEQRKSTVILSNLSLEEVQGYLGERVFDRLREDGGQVMVFKWDSHRKLEV